MGNFLRIQPLALLACAVCWLAWNVDEAAACQNPLRPIYNATQRQYVSCNAWEPDCPHGSFCQMATSEWKTRLQINPDFTLFLCCADEAVFKNTHTAAIVPSTPPTAGTELIFSTTPIPSIFSHNEPNAALTTGDNGNNHNTLSGIIAQQPTGSTRPFVPMLPRGTPNPRAPVLPPQAQIMLPGNGNRIADGPQVIQLVVGEIIQGGPDGMYKYAGSVTLVQDSGLNVLVDSGSAQTRNKLLAALAQQGIKPQNIQVVVYTHAHPDHIGNDNLFPYAQKMYSTTVYKGDEYMPLQHLQEPSMRLTQNIEVWQTPGHTYQHNSVIVRNVPNDGTVAISGDLFMSEEGLTKASIWQSVSVDKEVQTQMRNMILCQVDYIIPGHGSPFRVTPAYRASAGCPIRKRPAKGRSLTRKNK